MLKIWKLSRKELAEGWDVYEGAVVVSESEEKARGIHPDGKMDFDGRRWGGVRLDGTRYSLGGCWVKPSEVVVELVGKLWDSDYVEGDVILADFKAG